MNKQNKKNLIKSGLLKQPSILNLFSCALRELLYKETKNKRLYYPSDIGQYKFLAKIYKSNNFRNYEIAMYKDANGKKVFVKTWHGKTTNFSYYSLMNEYNAVKILRDKFEKIAKNKFRVPKPIGYFKNENSFSILLEYIDGKLLLEYPVNKQAKVIGDFLLTLDKVGSLLNKVDRKYIKKRDGLFYMLFLPLIFLYSFILEKENKRLVFYSLLRTYFKSISLLNSRLTLVHGDLDPDNIIVSGSNFYILDLEHLKYSLAEYDFSHFSIGRRKASPLLNILKKHKKILAAKFFYVFTFLYSSQRALIQ